MGRLVIESNLPFAGTKVYFSGSIKGAPEKDPEFAWKLVRYMAKNGADVLSEHVASRSKKEMDEIRARRTARTIQELLKNPEPWWEIRKQDNIWVDEATHMVALVNAPSLGVGMEIERALHKFARGLNKTPILALVHSELIDQLSYMVRGIAPSEAEFYLREYNSFEEARNHIQKFLEKR